MGDKGQAISQIRYPITVTLRNGESRKLESSTRLQFKQENPKLFGSMAFAAYEEYKAVKTVEEFFSQAARKNRVKESRTDLRFDVGKGYAQVLEPEAGCGSSHSAGLEAEKKQEVSAAMETPERTPETGSSKAQPGEAIKASDAELGPSQAEAVTVGPGAVAEERLLETAAMDSSTQQGGPSASTAEGPEEKLAQEPSHIESPAHDTAPTEDGGPGEGPATELASAAGPSAAPKGASSESSPGAGGQAAPKRARSQRSKSKAADDGGDEDGGSVPKKTRQSSEGSAKAKKHKKGKKEKPSEGKEEKVKKEKKKKKKKKEKADGPKPGAGSTEEQKEQKSRTKRKKPEGDETLKEAKARPSPSASSRLALALRGRPERSPDSRPVPTVAPALLPGGLTESGLSSLAGQPRQEQVLPAATAPSATTLRVIRPSDVAQRDAVWRNQATRQTLSSIPRRDSAASTARAYQELAPAVASLQPTTEARMATPDAQQVDTWTGRAAPLRTASQELAEPLVSTDPAERHRAWQARLRQLLLRSVEDADQVVAYVLAQAKAGQPFAMGLEVMSLEQARVELLRAGGGAKDALERERKRRAAAAKA